MKITLLINGREMSFSGEALTKIVESYILEKEHPQKNTRERIEGRWFLVNLSKINEEMFVGQRENPQQEETRKLIADALSIMKRNEQYREFEIQIPEKKWKTKSFRDMREFAKKHNSHVADWIEVALYWATQIQKEEDWHKMCNSAEDGEWYKVAEWKHTLAYIGNCTSNGGKSPTTEIFECGYLQRIQICDAVPFLVRKAMQ